MYSGTSGACEKANELLKRIGDIDELLADSLKFRKAAVTSYGVPFRTEMRAGPNSGSISVAGPTLADHFATFRRKLQWKRDGLESELQRSIQSGELKRGE